MVSSNSKRGGIHVDYGGLSWCGELDDHWNLFPDKNIQEAIQCHNIKAYGTEARNLNRSLNFKENWNQLLA